MRSMLTVLVSRSQYLTGVRNSCLSADLVSAVRAGRSHGAESVPKSATSHRGVSLLMKCRLCSDIAVANSGRP